MVAILPAALAQQTVAPGGTVTVEIPFSGEEVRFVDFKYTLSAGLEVQKGDLKGGAFGKAGAVRAIFLKKDLSGFNDGTLVLTVKAKADATGEQTINVSSVQGYKLGVNMVNMSGAGTKKITIKAGAETLVGDANGDGRVGHQDLTAIILHILDGKPIASKENADANGDGRIGHQDLTAIILFILDGKPMRP